MIGPFGNRPLNGIAREWVEPRSLCLTALTLLFLMIASGGHSQSLAWRAATIFGNACLADEALALGKGSNIDDGAGVVQTVGSRFLAYDQRGMSSGLRGTPIYKLNPKLTVGTYTCYVTSKNLKTKQLLRHFNKISKIAAKGQSVSIVGPAAIDGDTTTHVEGKRHTFRTDGREVILEAIFYLSDLGPVGAYIVSIEHRVVR